MKFLSDNGLTAFLAMSVWSAACCLVAHPLGVRVPKKFSGKRIVLLYLASLVPFYLMLRGVVSLWG